MQDELLREITNLLVDGSATTQDAIRSQMKAKGFVLSQPQISRLLKKINAIKTKSDTGEMIYRLPHDFSPPPIRMELAQLVTKVTHNGSLIIIKTSPGSASLIARILDNKNCGILGTIAGDDTIFVAPSETAKIKNTLMHICQILGYAKS